MGNSPVKSIQQITTKLMNIHPEGFTMASRNISVCESSG